MLKNAITEKATVLFVDDEADVLEILQEKFKDVFQRIYVAENAAEGLKILKSRKVDCLVSDVHMNGMNGIDFMKLAINLQPGLPVIMFTGMAGDLQLKPCFEEGIFDIIEKPYIDNVLIHRICNALMLASADKLIREFVNHSFPEWNEEENKNQNLSIIRQLEGKQKLRSLIMTKLLSLNARKSA